jgi:hypothetical protein
MDHLSTFGTFCLIQVQSLPQSASETLMLHRAAHLRKVTSDSCAGPIVLLKVIFISLSEYA